MTTFEVKATLLMVLVTALLARADLNPIFEPPEARSLAALYATCSVLKAENEYQINAFLQDTPNAKEIPLKGYWGDARTHGRQILPKINGGDGFYYALLEKIA